MRTLEIKAVAWLSLLGLGANLAAHGGQYRGPGEMVPPSSTSSSSSTPGSGGAAPGPTPGPGTAGGTANAPASRSGGSAGAGRVGARGVRVGDDLTRWQYWWEWNKDPYLRLKEAVHAGVVVRGSDDDLLSPSRNLPTSDTLRPTRADVQDKVLPALLEVLATTQQRDIVSSCLVAIAKIGRGGGVADLERTIAASLKSHDQEIRETAALSLGISRSEVAVPMLVALVRDDERGRELCGRSSVDERTRSFAAYGLGLVGQSLPIDRRRAVLPPLADVVAAGDTDRNLRVATINALRLLRPAGDSPAATALRDSVAGLLWGYFDRNTRAGHQVIRAHVLTAVAQLFDRGSAAARPHLARIGEVLRSAGLADAALTQAAAVALGSLCQAPELEPEDAGYIALLEQAAADNSDQQTRYFALMALGEIGGARCRAALLKALATGSKALVKPWAALALGGLVFRAHADEPVLRRDREVGAALSRELASVRNDETRAAFAVALGLCNHTEATDQLRALLSEQGHRDELAGYTCIGLSLMGARAATDDIRELVVASVRRPELLRQASIALGKIGDKRAAELLVGMLADQNRNLAKLSALSVALGQIGDRRAIDPLLELLRDESEPGLSRAFAAVALGGVADREDLPWNSTVAVGVNYRAAVETLTNGISGVLDIL